MCPKNSSDLSLGKMNAINSGWRMERDADGVKTYVRWIEPEGSEKVRERKSIMAVNCSVEDIVWLLSDMESTDLWMGGIRECYCLKKVSNSEWYAYTLFNIPWPFEKRDLVSNFNVKRSGENNSVTIHISSRDRYIPLKSDITRLADYTAVWTIAGAGKDRVWVSFSAVSNDPPMFPRTLQDPILLRMFHNNLVNLKKLLEG